jgi:hypothetical protein
VPCAQRRLFQLSCGGSSIVPRSETAAYRTAVVVDREEDEVEDREVEEIIHRSRFCKIGVLILPRRHDRWDRLVRKRVNTAKSKNQCSLSRTYLKSGTYVSSSTKVIVF